jgi:hypothetical protein
MSCAPLLRDASHGAAGAAAESKRRRRRWRERGSMEVVRVGCPDGVRVRRVRGRRRGIGRVMLVERVMVRAVQMMLLLVMSGARSWVVQGGHGRKLDRRRHRRRAQAARPGPRRRRGRRRRRRRERRQHRRRRRLLVQRRRRLHGGAVAARVRLEVARNRRRTLRLPRRPRVEKLGDIQSGGVGQEETCPFIFLSWSFRLDVPSRLSQVSQAACLTQGGRWCKS